MKILKPSMMMKHLSFLLFTTTTTIYCFTTITTTTAFLFPQDVAHPYLTQFANTFENSRLVTLDIDMIGSTSSSSSGSGTSQSRMYISNLVMELKNENSPSTTLSTTLSTTTTSTTTPSPPPPSVVVPLPITNSPNPKISSGPLQLQIHNPGSFISLTGTNMIPFTKIGNWELTWIADKPAGFIVCGLHLESKIQRNDAIVTPGTCYMNIPLWNRKGLNEARDERKKVEAVYQLFLQQQQLHLDMVSESNNPIQKVIHFQKACVVDEKLSFIDTRKYQYIPMDDDDLMEIGPDLLLFNKGTIWRKNGGDGSVSVGKNSRSPFGLRDTVEENVLLGHVHVKKVEVADAAAAAAANKNNKEHDDAVANKSVIRGNLKP